MPAPDYQHGPPRTIVMAPDAADPATPQGADSDPARYFAAGCATFARAAERAGGVVERIYAIGGGQVRLHFAGPALLPLLTPALAHLATAPGPVAAGDTLTISVWDSASTGITMPPPAWGRDDHRPRGEIRGYDGPGAAIRAVYHDDLGALSIFDRATNRAIFWARDARLIQPYEVAAPLRSILHWWLATRGRQIVHGGAVGTAMGGVVVVGRGGSGKSTTCLACLTAPESGLFYAGDDYVALDGEGAPRVDSLYASAKYHLDQLWRLPRLAPLAAAPDGADREKAMLVLSRRCPERLSRGFPLRAILLPQIVGGPASRLYPTTAAAALMALAPSTILQLAGAGAGALRQLSRVAAQVPAYVLALGDDTARIPPLLADLLATLPTQVEEMR